jgi:hypothetical protein
LVRACAVALCLVACSAPSETISGVDGPFGGVYRLRQVDQAPLPFYFGPAWYPGRATTPGAQTSTLVAAELSVLSDGKFVWSTLLDESATRPGSLLPEYVSWQVRRNAYGTWKYTAETGEASLEGIDQTGEYILTGSATGGVLTLSSTFTGRQNLTFVLER